MLILPTETALAYTEALAITGVENISSLIWQEKSTAAALGVSQSAERELNLDHILSDKVRIVRRQSGGGAVILNSQTICCEIIAPIPGATGELSIKESFSYYTKPIIKTLSRYNLEANVSGISDITLDQHGTARKVAGCAQLRKKRALVVHVSILVDLDPALLERYLSFPSEVPDYRRNRSHTNFCLNLCSANPELDCAELSQALAEEFTVQGWTPIDSLSETNLLFNQLMEQKYLQPSWNIERKRPRIDTNPS